jgi:hypothetical protein
VHQKHGSSDLELAFDMRAVTFYQGGRETSALMPLLADQGAQTSADQARSAERAAQAEQAFLAALDDMTARRLTTTNSVMARGTYAPKAMLAEGVVPSPPGNLEPPYSEAELRDAMNRLITGKVVMVDKLLWKDRGRRVWKTGLARADYVPPEDEE